MKQLHELDSEITRRNYIRELELCQKAGGDIVRYRRLSFDAFQLEQLRLGLEHGIDVERYTDPKLTWLDMENIRISMESGVDISIYKKKGFDRQQCNEIREGIIEELDISQYADRKYLAAQMKEIRKGLSRKVDVSWFADPELDWMQMREIRRGLEEGVNVSQYASKEYRYLVMRAIRKALVKGQDIVSYAKKGYSGKALMELSRGLSEGNDLSDFLEKGYDEEQLEQINNAYAAGVNLLPYLSKDFYGTQLEEIVKGLISGVDVSRYAKTTYNWFQMRELRYGMEDKIDVTPYANPDFTFHQMAEIRKGIIVGLDVTEYAKIYYEPDEMAEFREKLEKDGSLLKEDVKSLMQGDSVVEPEEERADKKEPEEEKDSDQILIDSCIVVSEDKMTATLNFTPITGLDMVENMDVGDVLRIMKHHDIKQGIKKDVIIEKLNKKDYFTDTVVAEGKQAVDGTDGKFLYYFRKELKKKPRVLENGTVDYKSMELFEMVQSGQLVAEYQPATSGVFGYDITGKLCSPARGKELPPLHGKGFTMSEDRKKYYSMLDGIIELDAKGNLDIRNVYTVPGNVDISTGNINFNGDVNIVGSIESGYTVNATGNVVVNGSCEGGSIDAGKDIILHKGCQGQGIGSLKAGGTITGQFFESVSITAGGDVVASYLLNCDVRCDGKLLVEGRRGLILGGYMCAKQGVNCYGIGNITEIKTVIEVGISKEELAEYQELLKKIKKIEEEIQTCENALSKFMSQQNRDKKIMGLCDRLTKAVYIDKTKRKDLLTERNEKMTAMTKQKEARIVVSGAIYPGTVLYINSEPYIVKDVRKNVQFVKHENKIDVVNS